MDNLNQEIFEMCTNYLCTHLRQQMASLGDWEDWKIRVGSHSRGNPITCVPHKLSKVICEVMEQFKNIRNEQEKVILYYLNN